MGEWNENWPDRPDPEAEYSEWEAFVEAVSDYEGVSPGDKCNLIQAACDALKCSSDPPFEDLCSDLRDIAEEAGCSPTCGPPTTP